MNELGDLDQLENLLRGAVEPGRAGRGRHRPGPRAARRRCGPQPRAAGRAGQDARGRRPDRADSEGRLELTPAGIRKIGRNALADLFTKLARDKLGQHEIERTGVGHERAYETKPYEFGDPFNLHIERTVRNAIRRAGRRHAGAAHAGRLRGRATEHLVRSSTVLMLDLSLSMPMRDNFLAAKKVAMALHSLISTQFPRDYLGIVGFSEVARIIKPARSCPRSRGTSSTARTCSTGSCWPASCWPAERHEADHHDHRRRADRPHHRRRATPFFHYPPVAETIDATLAEVMRCTREGIRINTFMLDATRLPAARSSRSSRS